MNMEHFKQDIIVIKNTYTVYFPYLLNKRGVLFRLAYFGWLSQGIPLVWHQVQEPFARCKRLSLYCLVTWHNSRQKDEQILCLFFHIKWKNFKKQWNMLISTLWMFKLCMCNMDKCKILTVGTRNFEIVFSFIDVLNSNPIRTTSK